MRGQGKKLRAAARLLARGELHTEASSNEDQDDREELDLALAGFGLVLEDAPRPEVSDEEPFYLWPENLPALELWASVQTQWRHGFEGKTGLDYSGVGFVMERRRVKRSAQSDLFAQIQVMERAALSEWARQRAER